MSPVAFVSELVVTPGGILPAAILVEDGRILELLPREQLSRDIPVTNFGSYVLLPGLVDSHVHINEPGRTDWEGFSTATRAAAAGGYTLLVDMPLNCLPPTTTIAALEAKRSAAQGQCVVDWMPWGGVVHDNQDHIASLAAAGVPGFKCFLIHPGIDGFTMINEAQLRAALPHVARSGLPLLVHAELPAPVDSATRLLEHSDWSRYSTYLASRPDEAELSAICLLLSLCREFRFRLHIVHLATAQALELLRAAKSEGLPITVETCPHYLHFSAEQIADGQTLCKCAPPIRSRDNREKLWQALGEGLIDLVATDHSPCPPEMKRLSERNFRTAWGGIAGISLALPVMWTQARSRHHSLLDVVRWMAEGPARLAGCSSQKGRLAPGFDADFVVFDPDASFVVTPERLHFRHSISPYLGETLFGVVQATYLRGECVFAAGQFPSTPEGRELRLSSSPATHK